MVKLIDHTVLRELSKLSPLRSTIRIFIEWSIIIGTIIFVHTHFSWPLYILSLLVIASRQHALLVLMHEAAHFRLFRSRPLNDVVGETILAWPHFMNMRGYRRHHDKHHDRDSLNTMGDPDWKRKQNDDWVFPMKKSRFFRMIAFDILGLNTPDYLQEAKDAKNNVIETMTDRYFLWGRITYYVILACILTYTNLWAIFLGYWVLSILTFLKAILRIRSITDHFALSNENFLQKTRITHPLFWERLIIAPANISIHTVHHLYPSVPYYHLPKLLQHLRENSEFQKSVVEVRGFREALKACVS